MRRKRLALFFLVPFVFLLSACASRPVQPETNIPHAAEKDDAEFSTAQTTETENTQYKPEEGVDMKLLIGNTEVSVRWENNESIVALRKLVADAPLTVSMSMYGGFEQVGSIGTSLPRNDSQTTTQAGDIVLYSGNQIVVFYGSNSWSYTRLGKITDRSEADLKELLGNGDVEITLSLN